MNQDEKLPITEELDFAYLLELLLPLYGISEFAWLPELFSIIGHEKLITLCKYAGGETITIPTLQQLSDCIDIMQWYYDVQIKHTKSIGDVPAELRNRFYKVIEVFSARDH